MSHSFSTALPETGQPGPAADGETRPGQLSGVPVVERIAGWSARHRKTAVLGWLVMVAAIFVLGNMLPAKNVPSNDAGQSGRAEQTLERLGFTAPPAESVLIQERGSSA